ncbi:MAG TPA: DUF4369 domain-containing protein, partial [Mucilaginibacter sp.]|nr:DUF4369 domain-containing protein [Mucilaginibacter sp.]
MKIKSCFLLLIVVCNLIACTKAKHSSNTFTLKGKFTGRSADTIFLTYRDTTGEKVEQSAVINNGSFFFKGYINSPFHADLTSNIRSTPASNSNASNFTEIFLSPGEMTIDLRENDFDRAKITGSPTQEEWNDLIKSYEPVNKMRDSLYNKMVALERAGNTPKNHIAHVVIAAELDKYRFEIDKIDYNYISLHPQSYLSAYLLENYLGTDIRSDSIEMFYSPFSDAVKESISGKIVGKEIAKRKASAVGSIVKMPSGINVNGSRFDAKAFKTGNYALLYFWAGWANDNARLKPVLKKYQAQGLKILAISTESFKKIWLDSIKLDHISNWH